MTVEFTQFTEREETIPVKWGDAITVQVRYAPGSLTGELMQEAEAYAKKAREDGTDTRPMPEMRYILSKTIVAWDVTREGVPFPLDPISLSTLPTTFLNRISDAIGDNERPKEANDGSFGAG